MPGGTAPLCCCGAACCVGIAGFACAAASAARRSRSATSAFDGRPPFFLTGAAGLCTPGGTAPVGCACCWVSSSLPSSPSSSLVSSTAAGASDALVSSSLLNRAFSVTACLAAPLAFGSVVADPFSICMPHSIHWLMAMADTLGSGFSSTVIRILFSLSLRFLIALSGYDDSSETTQQLVLRRQKIQQGFAGT